MTSPDGRAAVQATGPPTTQPVTAGRLADLAALFGRNKTTDGCWCLWFIIRAKDCHAGWGAVNKARFADLTAASATPMGVLAYRDGKPIGWCAAGPRERYARALAAPTLAGHDPAEDSGAWLVPCFFVRRDARRTGVTHALLARAVDLAREHGATAIEGFPLAGGQRRPASDAYVGVEPLFADCGFRPIRRPSTNRVVMRRDLV
jgi:GNAT superfamily N-acetyltransferase